MTTSSKRTTNLLATLLGGLVLFGASTALAQVKIPLITFHSPSRGDYFTTSNPAWTCAYFNNCPAGVPTPAAHGYVIVGIQGHVFNPANPQPPGTNKLHLWFHPGRGDNFLTTDPNWVGALGEVRDGYTMARFEGYLAQTGSMPLKSYWSATEGDNAAVTSFRWSVPAGYTEYRVEGHLLPPDDASCSGAPSTSSAFVAQANVVSRWNQPSSDFIGGDRIRFTAPADWYTYDYWGHTWPVRGYSFSSAAPGYPAPGRPILSLLARVTTGRIFVASNWYEAGQWFQALGGQEDFNGPCAFYDSTGVTRGEVETMFNDTNISDNSGGTTVTIQQWF